ncbi:hypothetical protein Dimus_015657 [Dionaea muscipula]
MLGICEYIKEVWEESKYIKPLEITRKFANDELINEARRNVAPRFGKRDTTSFMDLTYMDHLSMRRLVNLPRVMMRHMSYVISVKDHEVLYGDWMTMVFEAFDVPLIDKQGEEPKWYDFFEETFLTMCQLKRENGVWWLGSGENRRRDDEEAAPAQNEEMNEEERVQLDFDWEAVVDEAALQGESGSGEKFYGAEDEVQGCTRVVEEVREVPTPTSVQRKRRSFGVDPLAPIGSIPDSVFVSLQADFERARANKI